MRRALSAALALFGLADGAQASERPVRLDLPPGPLAVAIQTLSEETGANIGTSSATLLSRPLPALHLDGTNARLISHIARAGHARAIRVGANSWRLEPVVEEPRQARRAKNPTPVVGKTVVVIGSKRGQSLTDYPGAVTVIDASSLKGDRTITNLSNLAARVPTLASTDWGAGQDKLFLRGIADSSFAGSSPALVGEYLGDQRLTYSAPDPGLRLYDVASIEILDGPQGTLYGAGSLGGLIRIEPRAPEFDRFGGEIWSDVATTAHGGVGREAGAIANIPVVADHVAVRLVVYDALDPGYIDDTARDLKDVNSSRTRGGRAALRWRISSAWSIDLTGFAQRIDNHDAPYVDRGAPPLTRSSHVAQPSFDEIAGGTVVLAGMLGDIHVRSTTGILSQSFGQTFDVLSPGREFLFTATDHARLLTQETRLSQTTRERSWVGGFGALDSLDRQSRAFGAIDLPAPLAELTNKVFDVTAFGEVTQHLAGALSITLGAHYSADRLTGAIVDQKPPFHLLLPVMHPAKTEHHFLPNASLSYKLGSKALLFLRYERGFRTGGLTGDGTGQTYSGDSVTTLEAGARAGVAGRDRIAFTLTGAMTRWRDVQADLLDGLGLPYIANIGDGRIFTLDASLALRLTPRWRLEAAGFVTHNRLDATPDIAADGNASTLPNVAGNGATLTLDYARPLGRAATIHTGLGLQHVGHSLFGVGPLLAFPQGGYTALRLDSDVRLGAFDFTFDVSNLLDSRANAFAIGTPFAGFEKQQLTPLRPRTVRLGARYNF